MLPFPAQQSYLNSTDRGQPPHDHHAVRFRLNLVIRTGADLICIDKKIVEVEELVHTCHAATHTQLACASTRTEMLHHDRMCCWPAPTGRWSRAAGRRAGRHLSAAYVQTTPVADGPVPPRVPSLLLAVQANHYLELGSAGQVPFFSPPCLAPVQATPKKRARISLGQRRKTASA